MANISNDTAALVAAQLTAAWATRGDSTGNPAGDQKPKILEAYTHFLGEITKADGPAYNIKAFGD